MHNLRFICLFVLILPFFVSKCNQTPEQKLKQFNQQFFAKHVPEFPDAQLMTKADIPEHFQEFFDEAGGKLQLLFDVNHNNIPEYILCGFSKTMKQRGEKAPYFIAIFENSDAGIQRRYLHKLFVPPVSLEISKDSERNGVLILFSFYSDYSAEIYFENDAYHLEKMF